MPDPQNTLSAAASNDQSTHNIAAQATAARLLLLMEARYSWLGRGEPSKDDQDKLVDYIKQLDAMPDGEMAPNMPQTGGQAHPVVQLVSIMLSLDWMPINKSDLLAGLEAFVENYPGSSTWTLNDDHWSINMMYNSQTQAHEVVSASPARALTLVCAAILDEANHLREPEENSGIPVSSSSVHNNSEARRVRRMATDLAKYILASREGMERAKCSTGKQHDLLWLLQGSYLDADQKPFEFINDLPCYVLMLVMAFIQEQLLTKISDDERINLMKDWVTFSTTYAENMSNPLFALFERYHGESWQAICGQWIENRCAQVGINLQEQNYKFSETIARMDELGCPVATTVRAQCILELCQAMPVVHCIPSMQGVVRARNAALQVFKTAFNSGNWAELEKNHLAIADLYSAESVFQSVLRYSGMLMIGEEDRAIVEAGYPMIEALQDYFSHYQLDSHLPETFIPLKNNYYRYEARFRQQPYVDLLTNFFPAMQIDPNYFDYYWPRMAHIPELQLSDEHIRQIFNENSEEIVIIDEALPDQPINVIVTSLSTLDINRLLIHGLQVPRREWSEIYKNLLLSVCQWLLSSKTSEDSLALRAVKTSYPEHLLTNLMLYVLLSDASQTIISIDQDARARLFQPLLKNYFAGHNFHREHLVQTLPLLSPYFNVLIKKLDDLHCVLNLRFDEFNEVQREQLWAAVQDNLPGMVQNQSNFYSLFKRNMREFAKEQRMLLWERIKNKVPDFIRGHSHLIEILTLDLEQFDVEQRMQLWELIKDKLPGFAEDAGVNTIHLFFKLSLTQFNQDQRAQLFTSLEKRITTIFENPVASDHWFLELYSLDMEKFNTAQRDRFWELAVRKRLGKVPSTDIFSWVCLSNEQLSASQCSELLTGVQWKLVIQNRGGLQCILFLDPGRFEQAQRTEMFAAIKHKLPAMLRDTPKKIQQQFWDLSPEQLTQDQRNLLGKLFNAESSTSSEESSVSSQEEDVYKTIDVEPKPRAIARPSGQGIFANPQHAPAYSPEIAHPCCIL